MMLRLQGTRESLNRLGLLPFSVNTQLMKGSGLLAVTGGDAVVVKLESRLSQPIEVGVACETLDFQIELWNERLGIYECAKSSACFSVLCCRCSRIRRLHRRIDSHFRPVISSSDTQRESSAVIGADSKTANDVAASKRVVGSVEKYVAVLRRLCVGRF